MPELVEGTALMGLSSRDAINRVSTSKTRIKISDTVPELVEGTTLINPSTKTRINTGWVGGFDRLNHQLRQDK